MAYPILAPSNTWFIPNDTTITRSIITEIEIMDSYTPDASVTVRDSWDASEAKDGSITCYVIETKLIIAGNGSGKIAANEDTSYWFEYNNEEWTDYDTPENVERIIGLSFLDTSNVRTFEDMFYYCKKIKTLDLSTFDTSSATNLSNMFRRCNELSSLNISNWNTSKVTTTYGMFNSCESLEYVEGLDDLNTSNVVNLGRMFSYTKITNFTNLDTSKVTDMSYTFFEYQRETLTFPNWDISNVENFKCCFSGGPNGGVVKTLDLSNFKHGERASLEHMFVELNSANTIILPPDFGKGLQDLSRVFRNLKNVKYLNTENLNLSHATNLNSMFNGCSSLTDLDVSNWNVSNVTDMSFMFYGCSKLGSIDVSKWDTSKVTNLDHFAAHSNLIRIGMEKWNTSSLINANAAFHNTGEEELDLSGWDVSNVQFFSQMFENSTKLKRIKGLEKWDTSNALVFDEMFGRCSALEELDLSGWDTRKAKKDVESSSNGHTGSLFNNMFQDCNNLKKVKLGENFSINGDGTNTTASYKFILPTPSSDYIEGADGYWYTLNGDRYETNGVKDKTAEIYYASYNLIVDEDIIIKNGNMLETAKAIRTVNKSENKYKPSQFAEAIEEINSKYKNILAGLTDGSITELIIPEGVTSIVTHAFYYCTNMSLISLPDSITTIGGYSFHCCRMLNISTLPAELDIIDDYAFSYCTALTTLTFKRKPSSLSSITFTGSTNLTTINVPWAEGEVDGAPWGATNATINYNYTQEV